jgi:hypothetical protein
MASRTSRRSQKRPVRTLNGMRAAEAAIERPRAQGAASDADHAHGVVTTAYGVRELRNALDDVFLKREVREPVAPFIAQLLERLKRLQRLRLGTLELGGSEPVLFPDHAGEQILLIKLNVHLRSASE